MCKYLFVVNIQILIFSLKNNRILTTTEYYLLLTEFITDQESTELNTLFTKNNVEIDFILNYYIYLWL